MIKIDKDTKVWILFVIISTISIVALLTIGQEFKQEISQLEIEISELESQITYLNKLKNYYIELVRLQEKLEENLTSQIELLEIDLIKLEVENEQLRTIRAKLTAYSPLDNVDGQQAEGNPTRTSIGRRVGRNIAAADPKKLPYGTKLEVPGYGIVEIGDTGGALRNDNKNIRIDLYHDTYNQAMKFGVKDQEVKILEWGDKR